MSHCLIGQLLQYRPQRPRPGDALRKKQPQCSAPVLQFDALRVDAGSCVEALVGELTDLGFDPAVGEDGATTSIAFTHCPFRDLAEAYPELVCHLHRGIVEGLVGEWDDVEVERFATLADRDPCHVELEVR